MKFYIFVLLLSIGVCQAEITDSIPDLDDFEVIKERCDQKAGAGAYDKIKTEEQETQKCIKGIINLENIKNEVEEAKKTGSMDEVFGKYCGKRPQIKECIKKTYDAVLPCLEENEKQALNVTGTILRQISDFACYRDGDRIAMFVAEGGVECLNSRVESIRNCVNQTLKFNPATFSPNSISNLTFDKKKCDDMTTIQNCIVKDLEDHCSNTTPANVVDALFRFVKKSACKDVKRRKRSISLKRAIRSIATTPAQLIEQFAGKLKATCEKNGDKGDYEKLMAAYNESVACFRSHCRLLIIPLNTQQSCVANCTEDTRNALKKCLKENERYYADLLLEISQASYKPLYKNAELILGNPPHMELVSCMRIINQEETQKKLFKCFNNTSTEGSNTRSDIITIPPKSQLCEKLKEANTCVSNFVKNTCIKDIKITNLMEDLFESIETPCQNKTLVENEN